MVEGLIKTNNKIIFDAKKKKFGVPKNSKSFKGFVKFKDLKKRDKKKEDKPTKRPWWHYILFFIVGIISLFVGIMFVRFIIGAPPF